MKFPLVTLLLPILATATFKSPTRLTLSDLSSPSPILFPALSHDGIISLSLPHFSPLKRSTLRWLTSCLENQREVSFSDGTVRRSLAVGAGHETDLPATRACEEFSLHLDEFRSIVDGAVEKFVKRWNDEMGDSLSTPLLSGRDEMWRNVEEVVADGEVLEHFHSYRKEKDREVMTLDFHVDQGLFLAFTPGLMVQDGEVVGLSDGFCVRDSKGDEYEIEFGEEDDLVFMLGDGVNQYINNKLLQDEPTKTLLAAPHALSLEAHQDPLLSRVWYGRMIMPPTDAFIPTSDVTFGEARRNVIDLFSSGITPPMGIGCSSDLEIGLHGVSVSRELQGVDASQCTEDELFCWFRCMPLEDQNLTTTTCSDQNLMLQCVNPRGQVVPDGQTHGDFYPACSNSTENNTAYDLIEQQDNLTCPDLWEDFVTSAGEYDNIANLTVLGGPETMLMWSVTEDDKVKARLVYNDVFGWLSMGLANISDASLNGMLGANVLLATPYGPQNYSAATGLDTQYSASINTFVISKESTSFRHWQDPIETEESVINAGFEDDGCFTAISFESDHINGIPFNVDGTDEMVWAGNSLDYFVGYHGPLTRARFTVDWRSGNVTFSAFSAPPEEETHEDEHDHEHDHEEDNAVTVSMSDISSSLVNTNVEGTEDEVEVSVEAETKSAESAATCNNVVAWFAFVLILGIGQLV